MVKLLTYFKLATNVASLFLLLIITSCSSGSNTSTSTSNTGPVATNVGISDNNGGNVNVADTLIGTYSYSDSDNDVEGASTYRWLRNNVAINGASSLSYILVSVDINQAISFQVFPIAATGEANGTAVTSSSITVVNAAPVASAVTVTDNNGGNAVVGDTLSGTYSYADADSDVEGVTTYRWLRNSTAISGATASNYILAAADSGQAITFEVTAVATTGVLQGSPVSSNSILAFNFAPTANSVNIVDSNGGNAIVGDSLVVSYNYADTENDSEATTTFQWFRNGVAINGALSSSYTLLIADSGQSISAKVTPVAATGTTVGIAVASHGISVFNFVPTASNVNITDSNGGSVVVGDNLVGNYSYSDAENDAEGTSTFRWLRNGAVISGASNSAYTLAPTDSGKSIVFEVTPVALTGANTGSAVSSSSYAVINSAPTASSVTITDTNGSTVIVGDILTANYSFADIDNDGEGASIFKWFRSGVIINGATSLTYNLTAADSGQPITFEVTPIAVAGITTGGSVISSAIGVINSAPSVASVSITDNTGGDAVLNDTLSGNYNYRDLDNDTEGASTVKWLRNGTAISGANLSNYTLVASDIATKITFEVTPVATTGVTTGSTVTSAQLATGTQPVVKGVARFLDVNHNSVNDVGDKLIVPFDQIVNVGAAIANDFSTPISGDGLGANATVSAGPASNEVTILLGTSPKLKSRGSYVASISSTNSPSGIDISALIMANSIEGASGLDAKSFTAIDLSPSFLNSGQSLGGNNSYSIAIGDIDNDGDLDLAVANQEFSNRIYINNGSGAYTDSGQSVGSNSGYSRSVKFGDLDNDNDLDMVVANFGQANRVYINNGLGTYTSNGQTLLINESNAIALGDVDGDGDLDYVVANSNQGNRIYINNGNGLFVDSGQSLGTNQSLNIDLGDIDGDGDLDVVVANYGQGNRIYLNNGSGVYTDSAQALGLNKSFGLALGDVDRDGDLDLVVANYNRVNSLYINNGTGSFADSGQSIGATNSYGVSLNDMDGDGDLDIVEATISQGSQIHLNDGTGTFTSSGQALGSDRNYALAVGDVDKDGDLDFVVANSGQANKVYLNSLSGTWGSSTFNDSNQSLNTKNSQSVAMGDIDNDGDLDMVVANQLQGNRVYKGIGNGFFIDTAQSLGSNRSNSVALGDVDNDGDLDMLVANTNQGNQIYTNNGSGVFTDSAQSLGANNSIGLTIGDVDADGDLDLVVANFGQGNRLYTNNGAGVFTDSGQSIGSGSSYNVSLGDLDGDGDLDLVEANSIQSNQMYLNNGLGVFSNSGAPIGLNSNWTWGVALGDIDADGDLDMVFANNGQANRVFINNGSASFTDSGQLLGNKISTAVKLGDVDGDGDLDMVVTNSSAGNRIYHNNLGVFTDSGQSLGAANSNDLNLVDVDRDGDLDMVVVNGGQANKVYLNQ